MQPAIPHSDDQIGIAECKGAGQVDGIGASECVIMGQPAGVSLDSPSKVDGPRGRPVHFPGPFGRSKRSGLKAAAAKGRDPEVLVTCTA